MFSIEIGDKSGLTGVVVPARYRCLNILLSLLYAGKSLYRGRRSTTCAIVNPIKKLAVTAKEEKHFVLFYK
jgi:hypothetical protein